MLTSAAYGDANRGYVVQSSSSAAAAVQQLNHSQIREQSPLSTDQDGDRTVVEGLERHDYQCYALLADVIASPARKALIEELVEADAQTIANFLSQSLFVHGAFSAKQKRIVLHLLSKLSKSAQVFPKTLQLENVQCDLTLAVAGGGYGNIYKGKYEGKQVCVKALRIYEQNKNLKQKLRAQAGELIIWAHVSHRNILPFCGMFFSEERAQRVCIVSPWMENGDLLQYLKNFPNSPRIPFLHDIISGLHFLHELNVIHADLKAKNVIVSETRRAMLADFGISRILMTLTTSSDNIATGTAHWMAPEMFLVDDASPRKEGDIWAFGCICYEILTCRVPFDQFKLVAHLINGFTKRNAVCAKPKVNGWSVVEEKIWTLGEQCRDYDPQLRPKASALLAEIAELNISDSRLLHPETWMKERTDVSINLNHVYDILHRIQQVPDIFPHGYMNRYKQCCTLVMHFTASQVGCTHLTELKLEDAQLMADFLSKLLDDPASLSDSEKITVLHLLSKLVKSAQVFPRSLELTNVQCDFSNPFNEGGSGNIYRGICKGQSVCLKTARVSARSVKTLDIARELRIHAGELIIWAHLSHQNILPFLGIFFPSVDVHRVALVSPWMENGGILNYLNNFPDTPRIPLLRDIISGLRYLHAFGIIHGDLKARKIFISEAKRAMIADFGLSHFSKAVTSSFINNSSEAVLWQAPELLRRGSALNEETDIWAFGCTCYEVLTGLPPFHEYEVIWDVAAILREGKNVIPRKPLPGSLPHDRWIELNDKIWPLAEKCWECDPKHRPSSDQLLCLITSLNVPDYRSTDSETPKANKHDAAVDYELVYDLLHQIQQAVSNETEYIVKDVREGWDTPPT